MVGNWYEQNFERQSPTNVVRRSAWAVGLCVVAIVCIVWAMPLGIGGRVGALALFALGHVAALVVPRFGQVGGRLVGLGLLSLALAPSFAPSLGWLVLPTALLGFASVDTRMMLRVAISLPMVLASMVLSLGGSVSGLLIFAWVLAVVLASLDLSRLRSERGTDSKIDFGTGRVDEVGATRSGLLRLRPGGWRTWRRPLSAALALIVVAPVALFIGHASAPLGADIAGGLDPVGESTYPGFQGNLDVGAPVELSDDVVLRVDSEQAGYWRATTYENWDGREWTSSKQSVEYSAEALREAASSEASEAPMFAATREVTQSFNNVGLSVDVLPGVPAIQSVDSPVQPASIFEDGSISLNEPLSSGAEWTVTSNVAVVDADILRRSDEAVTPDSGLISRYASELDVEPQVVALAQEITAEAPTTYDKVKAIEQWMSENITYDRDIPFLRAGEDAVSNLLFESRIGFCEQIGSALVVMLRSLGIPARLAVGYVPSDFDSNTGEWVSLASDAHSWAEVYFPGVGWQGFDPTADVPLSGTAEVTAASPAGRSNLSQILMWAIIASLLLGVLLFVGVGWVRRGRQRHLTTNTTVSERLQHRFDRCGNKLSRNWQSSMTVAERAEDLIDIGIDHELMNELAELLEWFHYSPVHYEGYVLVSRAEELLDVLEVRCELQEKSKQLVSTSPR